MTDNPRVHPVVVWTGSVTGRVTHADAPVGASFSGSLPVRRQYSPSDFYGLEERLVRTPLPDGIPGETRPRTHSLNAARGTDHPYARDAAITARAAGFVPAYPESVTSAGAVARAIRSAVPKSFADLWGAEFSVSSIGVETSYTRRNRQMARRWGECRRALLDDDGPITFRQFRDALRAIPELGILIDALATRRGFVESNTVAVPTTSRRAVGFGDCA